MIKNLRDMSYAFFLLMTGLGIIWFGTACFETIIAMGTNYEPILLKIPRPDLLTAFILFSLCMKALLVFWLLYNKWDKPE
jgi:hypothetical protein